MKNNNLDYTKRDELIFGRQLEPDEMFGGVAHFGSGNYCAGPLLTIDKAKQLINDGFLDPEDVQNYNPTAKEFVDFCSQYPQVKMHGYVVSSQRDDCRVTIEGLECQNDITEQLIIDFSNKFNDADNFSVDENNLFCWWD